MRLSWSTGLKVVARGLLAIGIAAVPLVAAGTAGAGTLPPPAAVNVITTPGALSVDTPNPRPAGRVTFVVRSTDPKDEHQFQILKLRRGVTIEQVTQEFAGFENPNGPPDPKAVRAVNRDVTFLGGVDLPPGSPPASFTETLLRGTYYLVDANAPPDANHLKSLVVTGRTAATSFPSSSAIVRFVDDHQFATVGHLPASGTILVRNSTHEPHFVSIQPVKAGTTDAQVQALFDKFANGQQPGPNEDFTAEGPSGGTGVVSPGYQMLYTYSLPAGLYDIACFYPDDTNGMPHAFMGMHKIVFIG